MAIRVPLNIQVSASTSPAYSAGDGIGGLMSARVPRTKGSGVNGYVISAGVFNDSGQSADVDVVLFNGAPPTGTYTDNVAIVLSAADGARIAGVAHVDDWSTFSGSSFGQAEQAGFAFTLGKDDDLGVALVARAALTLSATDELVLSLTLDVDE